jgi:hypothetical protein
MPVFNAKDPNPPAQFYFDDEQPEDGHILIRTIPAAEMEKITKRTSKKKPPEYRRGVRYEVPPEINERLRSELMWDFIVVSWEGVLDEKGKKIPVTTENKVNFMQNWPAFAILVSEGLEQLTTDNTTIRNEEIKNSLTSQPE